MLDLQMYPWHLSLNNNVKDIFVFLAWNLLSSDNFYSMSKFWNKKYGGHFYENKKVRKI